MVRALKSCIGSLGSMPCRYDGHFQALYDAGALQTADKTNALDDRSAILRDACRCMMKRPDCHSQARQRSSVFSDNFFV